MKIKLTDPQREIIEQPFDSKVFLTGNAGCGKTTAGTERVRWLIDHTILLPGTVVMTPARTFSKPYEEVCGKDGTLPKFTTFNSMIQHNIELFWPVIAKEAGFAFPGKPPIFLTIETAQILMAHLIQSRIDSGWFNALSCPASRIYNQIMISMHKMAAAELPFDTYADRMKNSWNGDKSLLQIFDQVQICGKDFLDLCLKNNLLDYTLQIQVFMKNLLPNDAFQAWLKRNFTHFIYDNAEEDIPAAHHFAENVLKICQSALIITDRSGGFRDFMGADAADAERLKEFCPVFRELNTSFVCSDAITAMAQAVADPYLPSDQLKTSPRQAFVFQSEHQYPAMIKKAALDIADLIHQKKVPPSEIVIIAPLVSDVLYTSLERELRLNQIPVYLHRPSRRLSEENSSKSILTLAALLKPEWGYTPRMLDIVQMFQTFIPGLDPIRGNILVSRMFKEKQNDSLESSGYQIRPFEEISEEVRNRIPSEIGEGIEMIRKWISRYHSSHEYPDILLSRFFNEVLAEKGFNSSEEMNLGFKKVSESIRKYRILLEKLDSKILSWPDYFQLVNSGLVAASYYEEWFAQPKDSVLISLASAYIMMNRPVSYQIWLNAGSPRWWEKYYSQITNDLILSREWKEGDLWDVGMAFENNNHAMTRQIVRLLGSCRSQVRVYASELDEAGQDQKSKLLYVFAELAYRFGQDKPSADNSTAQFFLREEEGSAYPGIDDSQPFPENPKSQGGAS